MSELKPEYEKILSRAYNLRIYRVCDINTQIRYAIEECQALADRPPKMLTDDEIETAYASKSQYPHNPDAVRAVIDAHIAKQSEPDTVPFDHEKWSKGGWQAIDDYGVAVSRISAGETYTMRKI